MRGEEIRQGIDVFPTLSKEEKARREKDGLQVQSLGKSKKAATLAVGETALSRVLNSTPIMVLPPLILVRLQQTDWLRQRPRMTLPVNLGMQYHPSRETLMTNAERSDSHDFRLRPPSCLGRFPPKASSVSKISRRAFLG